MTVKYLKLLWYRFLSTKNLKLLHLLSDFVLNNKMIRITRLALSKILRASGVFFDLQEEVESKSLQAGTQVEAKVCFSALT